MRLTSVNLSPATVNALRAEGPLRTALGCSLLYGLAIGDLDEQIANAKRRYYHGSDRQITNLQVPDWLEVGLAALRSRYSNTSAWADCVGKEYAAEAGTLLREFTPAERRALGADVFERYKKYAT